MVEQAPLSLGRFGLRAKVSTAFAAIAVTLATTFGGATFFSVRSLLMSEFASGALDQVLANARLVAGALRSDPADEAAVLAALEPPVRSRPLLLDQGVWYSASLQLQSDDLPSEFVELVLAGTPAQQRVTIKTDPSLIIGVPFTAGRAAYFEVFSLATINTTLATLRQTLLIAGAATAIAGAMIGWWAAWAILRPIRQVSDAAADISAGDLSKRLDESLDPDLGRLAGAFNRMTTSLDARIAREARFASDVSHELRSPLTTLLTTVSVLERRRHELSPQGAEALDLLAADVKRLHQTLLDLIEISQHDAGSVQAELEEVQAVETIGHVLKRIGHGESVLEIAPAAFGTVVRGDVRRLERILGNLVHNAQIHGGGVTRIEIGRKANSIVVVVEDHGPGIPSFERERVFERFARGSIGRERGNGDGAGLGLALARENAHLHGGEVYLEEAPTGGCRAVLELPVAGPF